MFCRVFSWLRFSRYHSGHPFNLLAGGEVNGDNHTTNEAVRSEPRRDTGLVPTSSFDARLTWRKLGERTNLQLTAEGFNITTRNKLCQRK